MSRILYYLNNTDLSSVGIVVTTNSGLVGVPEYKERQTADFADSHGLIMDVTRPYLKERKIKLACTCEASNITGLYATLRELTNYGQLTQLRVVIGTNEPLVYNVVASATEPTKKWQGDTCFCEFDIEMIEPHPAKIVFKTTNTADSTASVTFKPHGAVFDIDWGDGTIVYDVTGTGSVTRQHSFTTGIHYPVISGDVAQITDLSQTNLTKIWTLK